MRVIIMIIIMLLSCSCVSTGVEYRIDMIDAKLLNMKMLDLYPDYKGDEADREVIEVSISSNTNFIEESRRKGMTLNVYTGECSDFKYHPLLYAAGVYFKGKPSEYVWPEFIGLDEWGNFIKPNSDGFFIYKIYLRYEGIRDFSKEKKLDLCAEFGGSAYFVGYKSNRIKLDLSQIEF